MDQFCSIQRAEGSLVLFRLGLGKTLKEPTGLEEGTGVIVANGPSSFSGHSHHAQ